jgi:hypothetical protein
MSSWRDDFADVFRKGWWLIAIFWGAGLVGASQDVGRQLYSSHHWHWPSPWWGLFLLAGWAAAAHLVMRDRRIERDKATSARDRASERARVASQSIKHEVTVTPSDDWAALIAVPPVTGGTASTSSSLTSLGPQPPTAQPLATQRLATTFRNQLERQRQDDLLRRLHRAYLDANPNASEAIRTGKAPLPKWWVEARLQELGETWRRNSYEL